MTVALAPGKALLCGEYAVLHGAPAISVAVDRCVRARFVTDASEATESSPFCVAALEAAARELGQPELCASGTLAVDSSALYDRGADDHGAGALRKIGLGSSAAVTVSVLGAAFARAGRSLDDRRRLFALADAAHAEAQGTRGSGVDVATAVWGGTIRYQRKSGDVSVTPVDLPDGLRLTFVFTGRSASTPELIGRVKALAEAAPAAHDAAIGRLLSLSHAFAAALEGGDAEALVRAADGYGQAMAALGAEAGCDIVTHELAQLAALARRHGGAGKPSGAGGGDLGVAFTVGDDATLALADELRAHGLAPLSICAPAPGLRLEMD